MAGARARAGARGGRAGAGGGGALGGAPRGVLRRRRGGGPPGASLPGGEGEERVGPATGGGGGGGGGEAELEEALLRDLEQFRSREGAGAPERPDQTRPAGAAGGGGAAGSPDGAGFSLLDKILIADFVFILFALAWLVAGVAQNAATDSSFLFESWFGLWEPVFQPALGVFMLGAIASGLRGKFQGGS